MEEGKSGGSSPPSLLLQAVAPFVAKTYHMVCDPRTDGLIQWGKGNNSFLVLDPADFSLLLLPAYFRHNNFSSFIRQLNTYGFRKVDPDKWEFAHEFFLKGQTHLLPRVLRRKKKADVDAGGAELKKGVAEMELEDEQLLVKELGRLREEQKVIEEEIQGMTKRIKDTESKPSRMMSLLSRLVDDPDLLVQKITEAKKRRLVVRDPPAEPATCADATVVYPRKTSGGLLGLNQGFPFPAKSTNHSCSSTVYSGGSNSTVSGPETDGVGAGRQVLYYPELAAAMSSASVGPGFLSGLG